MFEAVSVGDRQLHDRSSAPHHCPHQLAADQIVAVEQLRRQRQTGPAIACALGMALSPVGLILRRLSLNRLDRLEPRPPVIRYEKARPGELIHIDIKTLGRIDGIGHRITGQHRSGAPACRKRTGRRSCAGRCVRLRSPHPRR